MDAAWCRRMFGLIPGPCGCRSNDDHSAWRSHFCGLCNTLRARYGLWSRWLINRDSTFLALTGSALAVAEPEVTHTTCCSPLGKKRPLVQHLPHTRYAAAVTLCGLAVKMRDDACDERGLRRIAARTASRLLRRAEQKAVSDLAAAAFPVAETAALIGGQSSVERPAASLAGAVMPVSRTYAAIFRHLAPLCSGPPSTAAALADAGGALGRLIYTVDASEDYHDDQRRRRFNPLPASPALRLEMTAESASRDLSLLSRAISALPLRRYSSLIEALTGPALQRRTLIRLGMEPPPLPQPPPLPPGDENPPGNTWGKPAGKPDSRCGTCCAGCSACTSKKPRRKRARSACCDSCVYCDCGVCDCNGCECGGCNCGGCDCSC
jgi:Family of unknown function (DUF5685)